MTRVRAHRARYPDPTLDVPYPRILCGGQGGRCREVVAWVRPSAAFEVVMIPVGLTDDGSPGQYRWAAYARQKQDTAQPPRSRHPDADLYNERFARLPCVIPCRNGHENDVDTAVLTPLV